MGHCEICKSDLHVIMKLTPYGTELLEFINFTKPMLRINGCGSMVVKIQYCPFCGCKLEENERCDSTCVG